MPVIYECTNLEDYKEWYDNNSQLYKELTITVENLIKQILDQEGLKKGSDYVQVDSRLKDYESFNKKMYREDERGKRKYSDPNQLTEVANANSDNVSIISADNFAKIKDIEVGEWPEDIEILYNFTDVGHSEAIKIYVLNSESNTISVISPENNTKIEVIEVGEGPEDIEILYHYNSTDQTLGSNKIYVSNSESNTISVISPENNTKIEDIEVGYGPEDIVYDNENAYVTKPAFNTISVISTENNTKIKDIGVGGYIGGIEILSLNSPIDGKEKSKLYVFNADRDIISVISPENNTKIKDIEVEDVSEAMLFDQNSNTNTLYVSNSESNTISVISTENDTKIKDIEVGEGPGDTRVGEGFKYNICFQHVF